MGKIEHNFVQLKGFFISSTRALKPITHKATTLWNKTRLGCKSFWKDKKKHLFVLSFTDYFPAIGFIYVQSLSIVSVSTLLVMVRYRQTIFLKGLGVFLGLNLLYPLFIPVESAPFFKQQLAFVIGSSVSFYIFLYWDWKTIHRVFHAMMFSFVPVAFFFTFDFFSKPFRLKGTFTEPAHLGDYLTLLMIPSLIMLFHLEKKNKYLAFLIAIFVLALGTFSTLTLMRLIVFAIAFLLFHFSLKIFSLFLFVFSSIVCLFLLSGTNHVQYGLEKSFELFTTGDLPFSFPSLVDRVYPNIYAFKLMGKGFLLGLGPGSDWYAKEIVFDDRYLNLILPYKSSTSIANSLIAKLIIYWGFIPIIALFSWVWKIKNKFRGGNPCDRIVCSIALGISLNSFFGLGNFSFPYFWFWIGVVSVYFFKNLTEIENSCEMDESLKAKEI